MNTTHPVETSVASKLPTEVGREMRTLSHEVCNAIETIMQASYLVCQNKGLDECCRQRLETIQQAARKAAEANKQLREKIRENSVCDGNCGK